MKRLSRDRLRCERNHQTCWRAKYTELNWSLQKWTRKPFRTKSKLCWLFSVLTAVSANRLHTAMTEWVTYKYKTNYPEMSIWHGLCLFWLTRCHTLIQGWQVNDKRLRETVRQSWQRPGKLWNLLQILITNWQRHTTRVIVDHRQHFDDNESVKQHVFQWHATDDRSWYLNSSASLHSWC